MKYLQIINLNIIKKKVLKYYLIQLVSLILIFIIDYKLLFKLDESTLSYYMGLDSIISLDFLMIIIKVISIFVLFYMIIKIFECSVGKLANSVALRISNKKLISSNLLTTYIFTIILRLFVFITCLICFCLTKHSFELFELLNFYIYDLLYYLTVVSIFILILEMFSLNNVGKVFSVLLGILIIILLFIDIMSIPLICIVFIVIILMMLNVIFFNQIKLSNYLN